MTGVEIVAEIARGVIRRLCGDVIEVDGVADAVHYGVEQGLHGTELKIGIRTGTPQKDTDAYWYRYSMLPRQVHVPGHINTCCSPSDTIQPKGYSHVRRPQLHKYYWE